MNGNDVRRTLLRSSVAALVAGVAVCSVVVMAEAAETLRVYATETNRESVAISVTEKEQIINALLDRWQRAASRFGGDPTSWRDTFGLQLSMLPGSTLRELATVNPEAGFPGVVETVVQAQLAGSGKTEVQSKALGQTTTDLIFVPINPCRIVDTRFGGGGLISSGAPRDFYYANPPGGTFSAQGGAATNCGLAFSGGIAPLSPKAIAATVTVVLPSGAGNLVIYPTGTTPGTTSALNYTGGAVLANTTVIVGAQGGAADFTVALNGPTHSANVVVDAIGYYYAPAATAIECITVSNSITLAPGAAFTDVVADCPAGYTITGGGCGHFKTDGSTPTNLTAIQLYKNFRRTPQGVPDPNGWTCGFGNTDSISYSVTVKANCCRLPGR